MGRKSQGKGRRVELVCRDFLRRLWRRAYRVGIQMPVKQPDIDGTPFWVECKGSKAESGLHPWAALQQAEKDRKACHDDRPVLIYMKADRKPAVVMMLADEWLEREAGGALERIFGK
jgi:hypothetical protein